MEELEKVNSKQVVAEKIHSLADEIAKEEDTDKLKDLTELFKANQLKRNYVRQARLNDLQDMVDAEMMSRIENYPEAIENRELISLFETTQRAINTAEQAAQQAPVIQINNNKNEIHIDSGLSRESRARVLDAVNAILKDAQRDAVDVEVEEKDSK